MSNHTHSPVDHEAESRADRGRDPKPTSFWSSRAGFATIAFLAIGAFFLVSEHRAHLIPWLPWLILLACPLLHVFMHGGHGGHGGKSSDNRANPPHQH